MSSSAPSSASRLRSRQQGTALRTAQRAQALTEQLRQPEPSPRRARPFELDGDYGQALADGAIDDARQRLERRVRAHMPKAALSITLTDNRYTMISVRRDPKRRAYRVRLHHMFSDAEPMITRALARYVIDNCSKASRLLGRYIDEHQHRVRPRRSRTPLKCITRGDCHDLQAIFDDLNERHFGGAIVARISWGARTRRPRRRNSIKMGSYSVEDRFIRIHRTLDRPFVPRYFVEWIVYHEMLHQVHPARVVRGRRRFHTPDFLADEARFELYEQARAWERANLDRLLTY